MMASNLLADAYKDQDMLHFLQRDCNCRDESTERSTRNAINTTSSSTASVMSINETSTTAPLKHAPIDRVAAAKQRNDACYAEFEVVMDKRWDELPPGSWQCDPEYIELERQFEIARSEFYRAYDAGIAAERAIEHAKRIRTCTRAYAYDTCDDSTLAVCVRVCVRMCVCVWPIAPPVQLMHIDVALLLSLAVFDVFDDRESHGVVLMGDVSSAPSAVGPTTEERKIAVSTALT